MTSTLKIVNNDISRLFNNSGYTYVEGNDKVKQDVKMLFTTDIRPVSGFGTGLDGLVGAVSSDPHEAFAQYPIALEFQTRVRSGLVRMRSLQRKFQFSARTPQELIFDFSAAEVWLEPSDPREYRWRVDIITVDNQGSFSVSGGSRI